MPYINISTDELEELIAVAQRDDRIGLALTKRLEHELATVRKLDEMNAKGHLTKSEQDEIVDWTIKTIEESKPADLAVGYFHSGDWFVRTKRGVSWNWRMPTLPLRVMAEKLGLLDEWCNTPQYVHTEMLDRIKRNKRVKAIKDATK